MKLTLKSLVEKLTEISIWLYTDKIEMFIDFLKEQQLEDSFIKAVNEKYTDAYIEEYGADILDDNMRCAFASDLVSCFIDWSVSTDVDWSAINVKWQDYIEQCRLESSL